MEDIKIMDLTPENIAEYGFCGYKDVKIVFSSTGGYQGMLEYIPGQYAHRPVDAHGYLFIHCLFVGFKNEFKGKGLALSTTEKL